MTGNGDRARGGGGGLRCRHHIGTGVVAILVRTAAHFLLSGAMMCQYQTRIFASPAFTTIPYFLMQQQPHRGGGGRGGEA